MTGFAGGSFAMLRMTMLGASALVPDMDGRTAVMQHSIV
jgi:hypothetical protein